MLALLIIINKTCYYNKQIKDNYIHKIFLQFGQIIQINNDYNILVKFMLYKIYHLINSLYYLSQADFNY